MPQMEKTTAFAPLRSLNLDAPKQLLRSGELSEALNVDFTAHGGCLGRRKMFNNKSANQETVATSRPYTIVEWADNQGNLYLVWQERTRLVIVPLAGDSGIKKEYPLADEGHNSPGALFVLGDSLYYGDEDQQWVIRWVESAGALIKYTSWGLTRPLTAPTLTAGAYAGLPPGYYRYFYTYWDSRRNVESPRSPFSAMYNLAAAGSIKVECTAAQADNGAEYIRIYRIYGAELPNGDMNQDCWLIGITARCMAIVEASGSTIEIDDEFWADNGSQALYRNDSFCDETTQKLHRCRMAFPYGNHIHMLGAGKVEGSMLTSVSGKPVQLAGPYVTIGEGCNTDDPKAWFPNIDQSYTISNLPLNITAMVGYQASTLIFTQNDIYRISGPADSPVPLRMVEGHGVPGIWCIAPTPFGLIFWNGADLVRLAGASIEPFNTYGISSVLQGLDSSDRTSVVVGYSSTMRQLLVACRDTNNDQYIVLCYDFQRKAWTRWQTAFQIYAMREFYTATQGRVLLAWTTSNLKYYPSSRGEASGDDTMPGGSKFSVIYGTEQLGTEKIISNLTMTFGDWGDGTCALKLHHSGETELGGSYESQSVEFEAIPNATRTIGKVSLGQKRARFFELEVVGLNDLSTSDWYLHSVDLLATKPAKLRP